MTTSLEELIAVRDRFQQWLFEQAFPFWATTGCDGDQTDPARLGAQEHLTRSGVPALPPFKRVRVQARQLFVFSWAALQGYTEAAQRAESIFRFLLRARREDHGAWHGAWGRQLSRAGEMLDPTADLYDLAFVVFALAWYGRLQNDSSVRESVFYARKTLAWIDQEMSRPEGGFFNSLPKENEEGQQNPHMHLLEAVLALYQTTGEKKDLDRAHALYDLFNTRFYDKQTGTLGEYFTPHWQPAAGQAGQRVEPGHHFEWVWLLQAYQQATGIYTRPQAEALYHFARRYGVVSPTESQSDDSQIASQVGLVRYAVSRQGSVLKETFRLWVQTETLRGVLTHASYADNPESDLAFAVIVGNNILNRYFAPAPLGRWIEEYDHQGNIIADRIPTSSMYHIVTAYDSLNKAVEGFV
ncbi:MAG: AGE family epimerase/isomerase [Acetobacter sp.]|nr:AGE family epimerase/isomerase [Acetobacter sp.]